MRHTWCDCRACQEMSGSPFIYYLSSAESRSATHYRPRTTISIIANEAVLLSIRGGAMAAYRHTLAPLRAPDLFFLLSSSTAAGRSSLREESTPRLDLYSHSPFSFSCDCFSTNFENSKISTLTPFQSRITCFQSLTKYIEIQKYI